MGAFFRKEKKNIFLALDIGTESVKAVFFSDRIEVLGSFFEYFDRYSSFKGDYEISLMRKAALKAIEGAKKSLLRPEKIRPEKLKCFVSLSPDYLKTRVVSISFERKESKTISFKEAETIKKKVLSEVKKETSEEFSKRSGILPGEIKWIKEYLAEIKIDGYRVDSLKGYQGRNLDFKVIAIFAPDFYLEKIKKVLNGFNISDFVSSSCYLDRVSKEAVFIDIGGKVSQFQLVEKELSKVGEFNAGGRAFTEKLMEDLGLDENYARDLKERYSREELSEDSRKKIKEIFSKERKKWYNALRREVEFLKTHIPKNVFIYGGSSQLPDIGDALKEDEFSLESLQVEVLSPDKLPDIKAKEINNPQFIPILLTLYHAKEILRCNSAK